MIDAHTHVVSHDRQDYPLAVTDLPNGAWFLDHGCDIDGLIDELDGAGVGGVVLVQSSGAYSTDNRYLIDAQRRHPDRTVAICTLDVDPSNDREAPAIAATRLGELYATTGVRGTRLFALDFSGAEGWIADLRTAPVWETLAALGLPAVVTVFAHQLGALATMAARFPAVTVCIDHIAFPDLDRLAPVDALAPLVELAALDNVIIKVTSHLLALPSSAVVDAVVDILRRSFGAERMMWGSDYPQHHDRPYAELVALAVAATRHFSGSERDAFLGRTAATTWPTLGSAS